MIFLFNAKVKDTSLFKRYIDSISNYSWKRSIIYYESDSSDNLEAYIRNSFNHTDLIIRNKINTSQKEWTETYDLLNDDLVWISSRYDHVFVDTNFDHLNEVTEFIRKSGCEKLISLYLSNWPDTLKKATIIDLGTWDPEAAKIDRRLGHTAPCFAWVSNTECDSLQIITKELYKEWWMNGDDYGEGVTSPEDLSSTKKFIRPWKVQIPSRELLRNVEEINEKNNFIDYEKNVLIDKNKLLQYCLSKISPREVCLLNPRVEEGILIRIMKYYGLNRKD